LPHVVQPYLANTRGPTELLETLRDLVVRQRVAVLAAEHKVVVDERRSPPRC
jgi:hypothetical protein